MALPLSTHILYEDFSFHKSAFKLRNKWDFVYVTFISALQIRIGVH